MSTSARAVEALELRRMLADFSAAVDADQNQQTIDAIGAAANSGYQLPEYKQASFYNRVFGDLGITAVRSPLDPGFEPANDNKDAASINAAGFNDRAVANTMEFFKQAAARGVKTFLISVWSPPAWMKTNKSARHGGQLRPTDRAEFAEYVTAALLRARDKWGVTITHVSIGNEPWFVEPYPSAMWTPDQYAATAKVVAKRIKAAGLSAVLVGPEEVSSIYRTRQYVKALTSDPEASAAVPIVATHYLNEQDARTLADLSAGAGKKLWFSEVGNGTPDLDGAIGLARGIDSALARADAAAWFNWQLSLKNGYEALMTDNTPNPKYYALKHFARFVRPGDVRVATKYSGDTVRVSAYKNPATGHLSVVLSNRDPAPFTVTLSISGKKPAGAFKQYRTGPGENFVRLSDLAVGDTVTLTLPGRSIVTLSSGPDAVPLKNTTAAPTVPVYQTADAWETTPLRRAAMLGETETVKKLVEDGADVGARFSNGWDALFVASSSPYNGADVVVKYLLQHGANAKAKDDDGLTPLHVAAMNPVPAYGTLAAISTTRLTALLAAGADVNARDNAGRTPLMYAAMLPKADPALNPEKVDTSAIKALLNAGADKSLKDAAGRTALDYAQQEKAASAVELLGGSTPPPPPTGDVRAYVFRDANRNGTRDSGDTPLKGVSVYLDLDADNARDDGEPLLVTSDDGGVLFKNVAVGRAFVRAIAPDATYTPVEAGATVDVIAGATAEATLTFMPPALPPPPPGTASLRGYVIHDTNRDGLWTKNEVGLTGRTVWLDADNDGTLDAGERTLTTGPNGVFTFTGLASGTYNVRQILPNGWKQTYPTSGKPLTIKLTAGQAYTGGRLSTVKA